MKFAGEGKNPFAAAVSYIYMYPAVYPIDLKVQGETGESVQ